MHTLFFGGISQYYYQNGTLIQDNQVPFVKTISRLTRDANNNLTEFQLPIEMPALKGAGAEFIPNLNLPHYSNKVFKLNDISQNSFLAGHIFGGISSNSLNPFANNLTNTTTADNTLYEVWLTLSPLSVDEFEIDGSNPYQIEVFPNPIQDVFTVKFNTTKTTEVSYFVSNVLGKIIHKMDKNSLEKGTHEIKINLPETSAKGLYFLTLVFDDKFYVTQKLIKN
jgi:hypothetical protein